ncbi:hypothetical protein [Streptomyces tendae]|uniref:hypothetical protein n=1 Tax=Streptomyces tendae TaxID=1932 RepID=UPI0036BA0272
MDFRIRESRKPQGRRTLVREREEYCADARSRLNTAYMTCAYLGGSTGSWLGIRVWGQAGW